MNTERVYELTLIRDGRDVRAHLTTYEGWGEWEQMSAVASEVFDAFLTPSKVAGWTYRHLMNHLATASV